MYKPRFLVNTYINTEILDIFEQDSKIARVCFHEAGHAIILTAFDGDVVSIIVYPNGEGTTFGDIRQYLSDTEKHDMICMAGFFFESLICGRYNLPFPENFPDCHLDVVNTFTGNVDNVIWNLEKLIILNDYIVKVVEDTAIKLFKSGLTLDGDTIRELWHNADKIK
ncbi:MAG: hypothetical protein OS112_04520 [Methanoregula sp.]|nr:MAG: hypothetical protein OS112_04520 [Methanoregula sp.]